MFHSHTNTGDAVSNKTVLNFKVIKFDLNVWKIAFYYEREKNMQIYNRAWIVVHGWCGRAFSINSNLNCKHGLKSHKII